MKELEQKIGQLFIWGFKGRELSPSLKELLLKYRPGGLVLFERNIQNPEQLALLTRQLQEFLREQSAFPPLFISVDQEGGKVSRLKPPFSQFSAAGSLQEAEKVSSLSALMAKELAEVGINMNFAPVLDVNTNPDNPIIGDRSFSSEPEVVAKLGITMFQEFEGKGVIAVGKHFPGHGDTSRDSHLELPVVESDLSRLKKIEFIPFQKLIEEGIPAIMTAHVLYPKIDDSFPATFSPLFLENILRREMGFKGLVISDDLKMKGASERGEITEMSIQAILAGVDILLICHDLELQEEVYQRLVKEARISRILKKKIAEAVSRILAVKRRYLKNSG